MWTSMETPFGEMRIVANDEAITAMEFMGAKPDDVSKHSSVMRAVEQSTGRPLGQRQDAHPLMIDAVQQMRGYFERDLKEFDLPLAPAGTPFQQRVWEQLRLIGYGETTSYGLIALRMGMKMGASRAVGLANGRNPIAIAIPCHRVVGAKGTLVGYAGGLERKKALLELEQEALF